MERSDPMPDPEGRKCPKCEGVLFLDCSVWEGTEWLYCDRCGAKFAAIFAEDVKNGAPATLLELTERDIHPGLMGWVVSAMQDMD